MRAMACLIVSASVLLSSAPGRASQAPACASPANQVVAENCKPGNPPTEWDVNGSGDLQIQGFATDISVNAGETIAFKVGPARLSYRIDIYRLGYYGGLGGAGRSPPSQPSVALAAEATGLPHRHAASRLYDCGNWAVSASWAVPRRRDVGHLHRPPRALKTATRASWRARQRPRPGSCPARRRCPHAYGALGLGKLANALEGAAREPHLLRRSRRRQPRGPAVPDVRHTLAGVQPRRASPAPTAASILRGPMERAYKVSLNRPYATRDYRAVNLVFNAEYPMLRWLEANGYDVSVHDRARQRPPWRADQEPQSVPVGRARRVLVWSAARERGGGARRRACTWRSSAATTCSGRSAGNRAPTVAHAVPDDGHLQGDARERQDRSADRCLDRHVARLPPVQPRRAEAGERAQGHDLHGQRVAERSADRPCALRAASLLAEHGGRAAEARRSRPCSATAFSATSGTRTSTTASGPRA